MENKEIKTLYIFSITELERSSKGGWFKEVTIYKAYANLTSKKAETVLKELNVKKRSRFWSEFKKFDLRKKSDMQEYLECLMFLIKNASLSDKNLYKNIANQIINKL